MRSVGGAVLWGAVGFAAIVVVGAAAGLRANVTTSLPVGLYRVAGGPIRRGTAVLACVPVGAAELARVRGYLWAGDCPGHVVTVGKEVVAVEGDTVIVGDSAVIVNGIVCPRSAPLSVDSRGRSLPRLRGRWILHSDEIWLHGGSDPRSFDSRYFGPVRMWNVRAVMRRLQSTSSGPESR